eukprot:gene6863-13907_t
MAVARDIVLEEQCAHRTDCHARKWRVHHSFLLTTHFDLRPTTVSCHHAMSWSKSARNKWHHQQ